MIKHGPFFELALIQFAKSPVKYQTPQLTYWARFIYSTVTKQSYYRYSVQHTLAGISV